MRGALEEGFDGPGCDGTYLNGFHEREVIVYPETAYAFAEHSQTLLNVTNAKIIRLVVDDEPFDMQHGAVLDYERALRLKTGLLERTLRWRSPQGREVQIVIQRLVSLPRQPIAAIRYQVTPLNFSGTVRFVSEVNGDVSNLSASHDPRTGSRFEGRVLSVESREYDGGYAMLAQRTRHTRLLLACAVDHTLDVPGSPLSAATDLAINVQYRALAQQGQTITLDKFIAYTSSWEMPDDRVVPEAKRALDEAKHAGFETLRQEQATFLEDFWRHAEIEIEGDDALQQGLRFNMFHLLQSVGRDGRTSIAAKGVTGEGYEGHFFWDTEMYVLPFFLHTQPHIACQLLEYRIRTLDKARERARQMAHPRGALYAWRTIDGEECSAYFPAGTAQYHINADIAFALKRYVEATGEREVLMQGGAEMLFETARLWADLGKYIPRKGDRFCINGVTGPDEYTAIVDNNAYTNLMAQVNLRFAAEVADWLQETAPDAFAALNTRIGLETGEVDGWKRAADRMYIPYDEQLGIYPQDDSFLYKAPWDFANTPPENYPLLLHYHPLVIYRHQVCKQADLVLAMFLLSERFTPDEKKRNYDFYEPLTTHDSSLSTCIFSIVASDIAYHEKAYAYFMRTARMDLDDYQGNVKDGVHIANMAGTWMSMVYGFAGLRVYADRLHFRPSLPDKWRRYACAISYQGRSLRLSVTADEATYELAEGDDLEIVHDGQAIRLQRGQLVRIRRTA
jgi:alpha,alpha-trehalose phosphorylase